MKDELSRIIAGILKMLVKATQQDRIDFDEDLAHEQIIYIITPELAKAEKWDRVKEIARGICEECPLDSCEQYEFVNPCEAFEDVVNALENEKEAERG